MKYQVEVPSSVTAYWLWSSVDVTVKHTHARTHAHKHTYFKSTLSVFVSTAVVAYEQPPSVVNVDYNTMRVKVCLSVNVNGWRKTLRGERDGSDRCCTSRSVAFEQQHDCRQQITDKLPEEN